MDIFLVFQRPLYWLIVALTEFTKNYGVAIILFTIIIRLALAPLYVAQIRASKKMMALSPKIKELQKRHGKDREALTKETMALYKEHNHNPALGCLLPLIQLPILWSLFLVLKNLAEPTLRIAHAAWYRADFLWLSHGLGNPDPTHILPIVAGITQWIQQRMMLNPTNDPQQRQMNQIMQFLPLMIVVFAWNYPSGLAVYWVTSNIIMMILQFFIGGWGSLWTSPLSVPYADGATAATVAKVAPSEGGFLARLLAPQDSAAQNGRGQRSSSQDRDTVAATSEVADVETSSDRATKMDRYAQRHGRGASRRRPSAKGAKK
ncbi:MAG: inner rane protein oxaA [Chloroflexi bacterium]|nr:inner rane protein oxaA [Chloroflexota bacterium]